LCSFPVLLEILRIADLFLLCAVRSLNFRISLLQSHTKPLTFLTFFVPLGMPDASDLVAAADTLAQASLYNEAISTYTKAIDLAPTAPQYYIKRYFLLLPFLRLTTDQRHINVLETL
jgi:hypothetical protein